MAPTASFVVQADTPLPGFDINCSPFDLLPPATRIQLHDIRQKTDEEGLVAQIVAGLKSEERSLPSLLLWNRRGLELFDAILDSGKYYPAEREPDLLSYCMPKMAYSISSGEQVIELGAGYVVVHAVDL